MLSTRRPAESAASGGYAAAGRGCGRLDQEAPGAAHEPPRYREDASAGASGATCEPLRRRGDASLAAPGARRASADARSRDRPLPPPKSCA